MVQLVQTRPKISYGFVPEKLQKGIFWGHPVQWKLKIWTHLWPNRNGLSCEDFTIGCLPFEILRIDNFFSFFFYKCYMYTKVFIQLEIMTVTVNLNSINTNINQETTKSCVNFFGAVNIGWHEGNSRACNLEVNHKRAKTNLNSGNQQKVSLHLQNPVSIRSLAWGAFCCNYQ